MKSYQQIKDDYQKHVNTANRLYWRGFWYPIGGFLVCTVAADLSMRSPLLNPFAFWILIGSLALLLVPLKLVILNVQKGKAVQDAIVESVIEGIKLEKQRWLGETFFVKKLNSHIAYFDKMLPLLLVLLLICLRFLFLLIVSKSNVSTFFWAFAPVLGSCCYVGMHISSQIKKPHVHLKKRGAELLLNQ